MKCPEPQGPHLCSSDHRNPPAAAHQDLELGCTQGSPPEALGVATTVTFTLNWEHLKSNPLAVNVPAEQSWYSWGASCINRSQEQRHVVPLTVPFHRWENWAGSRDLPKDPELTKGIVGIWIWIFFSQPPNFLACSTSKQQNSSPWGAQSYEELGACTFFQEIFINTGILRAQPRL